MAQVLIEGRCDWCLESFDNLNHIRLLLLECFHAVCTKCMSDVIHNEERQCVSAGCMEVIENYAYCTHRFRIPPLEKQPDNWNAVGVRITDYGHALLNEIDVTKACITKLAEVPAILGAQATALGKHAELMMHVDHARKMNYFRLDMLRSKQTRLERLDGLRNDYSYYPQQIKTLIDSGLKKMLDTGLGFLTDVFDKDSFIFRNTELTRVQRNFVDIVPPVRFARSTMSHKFVGVNAAGDVVCFDHRAGLLKAYNPVTMEERPFFFGELDVDFDTTTTPTAHGTLVYVDFDESYLVKPDNTISDALPLENEHLFKSLQRDDIDTVMMPNGRTATISYDEVRFDNVSLRVPRGQQLQVALCNNTIVFNDRENKKVHMVELRVGAPGQTEIYHHQLKEFERVDIYTPPFALFFVCVCTTHNKSYRIALWNIKRDMIRKFNNAGVFAFTDHHSTVKPKIHFTPEGRIIAHIEENTILIEV